MARTITVRARATDANGLVTERVATTVVADAKRFPGDPGAGKTMSGCCALTETSASAIDWLDANTAGAKRHKLSRIYGFPRSGGAASSNRGLDRTLIASEIAKGRTPVISTKYLQNSPDQIAAGVLDAQIQSDADFIKSLTVDVFNAYYHEPFDNFLAPTQSAHFRAADRRIVQIYRDRGVTNCAWVSPMTMLPYEYDPGGEQARGGPAYHIDPDWKGTRSGPNGTLTAADWHVGPNSVVDVFGIDQYSPVLGGSGGNPYTTFSAQLNFLKARFTLWNRPAKPLMVPEIGTQDVSPQPDWNAHWADFRTACAANDIIGYCYFNYNNAGLGASLINEDPSGSRLAAYNAHFQNAAVLGI